MTELKPLLETAALVAVDNVPRVASVEGYERKPDDTYPGCMFEAAGILEVHNIAPPYTRPQNCTYLCRIYGDTWVVVGYPVRSDCLTVYTACYGENFEIANAQRALTAAELRMKKARDEEAAAKTYYHKALEEYDAAKKKERGTYRLVADPDATSDWIQAPPTEPGFYDVADCNPRMLGEYWCRLEVYRRPGPSQKLYVRHPDNDKETNVAGFTGWYWRTTHWKKVEVAHEVQQS